MIFRAYDHTNAIYFPTVHKRTLIQTRYRDSLESALAFYRKQGIADELLAGRGFLADHVHLVPMEEFLVDIHVFHLAIAYGLTLAVISQFDDRLGINGIAERTGRYRIALLGLVRIRDNVSVVINRIQDVRMLVVNRIVETESELDRIHMPRGELERVQIVPFHEIHFNRVDADFGRTIVANRRVMQVEAYDFDIQVIVAFGFATTQVERVISALFRRQMPDTVTVANSHRVCIVEPFVRTSRILVLRPRTMDEHVDRGSHEHRGIVEIEPIEVSAVGEAQGIVVGTSGTVVPNSEEIRMVVGNGIHHKRAVGAYHVARGTVYPLVTMNVLRNLGHADLHVRNLADVGITGRFDQYPIPDHHCQGVFPIARTSRIGTAQRRNPISGRRLGTQFHFISVSRPLAGGDVIPAGTLHAVGILHPDLDFVTMANGNGIGFDIRCRHELDLVRTNHLASFTVPYHQRIAIYDIGIAARIGIVQMIELFRRIPFVNHAGSGNLPFISADVLIRFAEVGENLRFTATIQAHILVIYGRYIQRLGEHDIE